MLARWRNHFSQLFNAQRVSGDRQMEIRTTEPLLPGPKAFEVEMAIENLVRPISPGIDQIPAEMIKARGKNNFL